MSSRSVTNSIVLSLGVCALLIASTASGQRKKKMSLAEVAALEWKLEQAGNTLSKNTAAKARLKAVTELVSLKDPRTSNSLAQALREDPDAQVRLKAGEGLAALRSPEAKGLLSVARDADPDPAVRARATELLKSFPKRMTLASVRLRPQKFKGKKKPSAKLLKKVLKHPSGDARLWAIKQIGAVKFKGGTALLKHHLRQDPSARVRIAAAGRLVKLFKAKSLPLLIKAVDDGDPTVRFELARKIAKFDDPGSLMVLKKLADGDPNTTVKAEAKDLLEPSTKVGQRLLKDRIKKLASANPTVRMATLEELSGATHWRAMLPMSCMLLGDKSVPVRTTAAKVLTNMHDTTVLTAMRISASMEPDANLKKMVRKLLMGMRKKVDKLIKQLKSKEVSERVLAVRALGQGGYPQGLKALIKALKDPDPKVRLAAVEGLKYSMKPKAKEAIKVAAADSDTEVKRAVAQYFKRQRVMERWRRQYKDPHRLVMKTMDKDPIWRFDAAIALGVAGAERAVGNLAKMLLHDKVEAVRHAAAWALVLMASDRGENALKIAAAKDPSEKIRLTARKYLVIAKISLDDLITQLNAEDSSVRQDAAEALSLRPSGKALNYLIRAALCDPEKNVRSASLRGLARIGNPVARTVIRMAVSRDPDPRVRRTARMMQIIAGGK